MSQEKQDEIKQHYLKERLVIGSDFVSVEDVMTLVRQRNEIEKGRRQG